MPSTFFGLNIAYTGLIASNAGLNTTANNISNIETKGYSRQVVNQQAATALRTFTSYGCAGAGVDTLAAERQRNVYYDAKYRDNSANLGEMDEKAYYCKLIENYLTDEGSDGLEGFSTIFNEMSANMQTALTNNGDISTLADFVGSATDLCEYFNTLYSNLQDLQADANADIKVYVDKINSISQQIAQLNQQITTIEMDGKSNANELRDQRDLLVDELSSITDTSVKEYEVEDVNGNKTGATRYIVTICGGQSLVDGNDYRTINYIPREIYEKQNQNDVDGLYDLYWSDTDNEVGLYGDIGGYLKGLIDIRDGNNGEYFNGKISDVNTKDQQVTIDVTDSYLKDINKNTLALEGTITLSGKEYCYDSWTYNETTDPLTGEVKGSYTFQLSTSTAKNPTRVDKTIAGQKAEIGHDVNYQGVPYYLEQINEWVRCYANSFNSVMGSNNTSDIYGNSTEGNIFFTGNMTTDPAQYGLTVAHDATKYSSTDDSYYCLTAQNFSVLKSITQDAGLMGTHTDIAAGEGKVDILQDLYDMGFDTDVMSFRGASASDFLICVLGDAALNASSANSFNDIYSSMSETIENQRSSVSGVDTDEEAANLISYQNAYNLNSKMISVLTEVYDRLILSTGV